VLLNKEAVRTLLLSVLENDCVSPTGNK